MLKTIIIHFVVIVLFTFSSEASDAPSPECENVQRIDGIYYTQQILVEDTGVIDHIAVNWKNGYIFFITAAEKPKVKVIKDGKTIEKISGASNSIGLTINQYDGTVYIIGPDAIYKYDEITNSAKLFVKKKITGMDVSDRGKTLLYTNNCEYGILKLNATTGEITGKVIELEGIEIPGFGVDRRNNIFFIDGQWSIFNTVTKAIHIIDGASSTDKHILISKNNDAWYFTPRGNLFKIDRSNHKAFQIMNLEMERYPGLTLDEDDNILFGYKGSLAKLRKLSSDKNRCGLYMNAPRCQIDEVIYC